MTQQCFDQLPPSYDVIGERRPVNIARQQMEETISDRVLLTFFERREGKKVDVTNNDNSRRFIPPTIPNIVKDRSPQFI